MKKIFLVFFSNCTLPVFGLHYEKPQFSCLTAVLPVRRPVNSLGCDRQGETVSFYLFHLPYFFPRRRYFYRKNKSKFYDHVLCDHIFFGSLMVEGSENRSLRIFWIGARYMRRTRGPSALSRGGKSAAPNDLTRGTNEPQPPIYSHA